MSDKISETIKKRIDNIKSTENSEELKKYLCSFFITGGCPDCLGCLQTEKELDECKDDFLEKIGIHPMDIWDETFDQVKVKTREKIPFSNASELGVYCDQCYMYDKCPYFKKGYSCMIDWGSDKPETPESMYDFLITLQYQRVKRSSVFEQVDGGVPDAGLSGEMDRLSGLITDKANLGRERVSISMEASGSASSSGGGILAKIFGGGSSTPALEDKKPEPIELPITEAEYEEVKPKKRKSKESDK